ncbi:MAG: vitamin K epoxide reductase family protein, partial [Cyclobacteriaceae bacterium]
MSAEIIFLLLNFLKVRFTKKYILENFTESSKVIDLSAVTILLDYYGVDSLLVKISKNELTEIDYPCITSVKNKYGMFQYIVLTDVKNDSVYYFNNEGKNITIKINEFLKAWSMICILLDATEIKEEVGYSTNKKRNRIKRNSVLLSISLLCLGFIFIVDKIPLEILSFPIVFLIIIKLVGAVISFSILSKNIGLNSKILDNICGKTSKFDCEKVLNSPNSSLFGINLTEIGITYFVATTVILLLTMRNNSFWEILIILNLFSVSFSFVSIYYQAFKIKAWCSLCLFILILFWLEFLTLTMHKDVSLSNLYSLQLQTVGISIMISSALYISIFFLKNNKIKLENFRNQRLRYFLFKENIDTISLIIKNGIHLNYPSLNDGLEIGNRSNPQNKLIIVTNPHCNACRTKYSELRELIVTFREYLSIKVIISYDSRFINLTHYMMQY